MPTSNLRFRSEWLALRAADVSAKYDGVIPEGLSLGKPFRTMAAGPCVNPLTGRSYDVKDPISVENLAEFARVFEADKASTPVVIDWNHGSARAPTSPTDGKSLGRVLKMWVQDLNDGRGPGLYVLPAYTKEGAQVVESQAGALWSSPEFYVGKVYDRKQEDMVVGSGKVFAVALTGRPAQATDTLDPVMLSQTAQGVPAVEDNLITEPIDAPATDPEIEQRAEVEVEMMPEGEAEGEEAPSVESLMAELELKATEIQELRDANAALEAKLAEMEPPAEDGMRALDLQLTSLRAEVEATSKRAIEAEARADRSEADLAIQLRTAKGFIAPHEKEEAEAAYALRDTNPIFWQRFASRTEPIIPLGRVGHGNEGPGVEFRSMDDLVLAHCKEHGLNFRTDYMAARRAVEAAQAAK